MSAFPVKFSLFGRMGHILLQKLELQHILIVAYKLCKWLLLFYPEE